MNENIYSLMEKAGISSKMYLVRSWDSFLNMYGEEYMGQLRRRIHEGEPNHDHVLYCLVNAKIAASFIEGNEESENRAIRQILSNTWT